MQQEHNSTAISEGRILSLPPPRTLHLLQQWLQPGDTARTMVALQPVCSETASAPTSPHSPLLLHYLPYHITAPGVTDVITPPSSQAPLSERKDELTSSPAAWDHRTSRSAQHIPAPLLLQLGALTLRPYGLCCLTTHSCTSSTNLLLFPFLVLFTAHADPWWAISPAFVPPQLPSFFPSAPFCSTQRVTGSCFSTISLLQQAGGTSGQQKAHKEEAGLVGLRTAGSKASQAEGEFSQLISYTALCLEKL